MAFLKRTHFIVLLLILFLAFLLRFYQLTQVPSTLNPDEKFNGYLAYSLLTTGKDLDGNVFPITIKSFGSWTLIGYPLLTIVPVAIWGLTEFSARFIGALSGIVSVLLVYFVCQELFNRRRISLLAALFFAISPWSIYMSRISHEAGLGLTFFLGGLMLFLKAIKSHRTWPLITSAILFGASLLTHFAYVIFTTITLGSLLFTFRSAVKKSSARLFGVIFAIFFVLVVFFVVRGSAGEINDVGLFNNQGIIYNRTDRYLTDGAYSPSDLLARIHNRYTGIAYQLGQNYIASFSPKFLFDEGGQSVMHNMGFFGWLYQVDFALIIFGLVFLCRRKERFWWIVLAWLAISPLASFFTKDHPSSTRLFPMVGAFSLLSAYGTYWLLDYFRNKPWQKYLVGIIISAALAANFLFFLDFYFRHFDLLRDRFLYYGHTQAAEIAQKYPDRKVVMIGPENFPYISFLFYNQYDPDKFRQEVVYFPQGQTEFRFVKSFGRYEFVSLIDRKLSEKGILYFDHSRPGSDWRNLISLPSGESIFTYYTVEDLDPKTTDVK